MSAERPGDNERPPSKPPRGNGDENEGLNNPEDHRHVIQILQDPAFGLQNYLQGMDTLSPQEVAKIWNGENLTMLRGFPTKGTPDEKNAYLAENPNLQSLIDQTRQILSKRAEDEKARNPEPTEDLDAALAQDLDGVADPDKPDANEAAETPDQRNKRLENYVAEYFKEECPAEFRNEAAGVCMAYETELRETFEEPELELTEEDIADVKPQVINAVTTAKREKTVTDLETTAAEIPKAKEAEIARSEQIDARVKAATGTDLGLSQGLNNPGLKPADIDSKISTVDTATAKARDENEYLKKKKEDKIEQRDQEKVKDQNLKEKAEEVSDDEKILAKEYDRLLDSGIGQAATLKQLMGMVKSPEVKARLQNFLNMVGQLQTVLPVKSGIVTKYLNASKLNLGSTSVVAAFAPFIAQIDAAPDLTDEDKDTIRKALHHQPNNSRDAQSAILQGRGVETDPETGKVTKLPYDKDHPLELEGGGVMYSDNGALVVATEDGWTYRVDGGILPGDLTRIVSFGKDQHKFKSAGIEDFMGFKFGLHKPEKHLKQFQDIKNQLLGGSRGLEGTYASERDSHRYMHIVKFISHFGESPVKVNEGTMAKSMKGLGLTPQGILEVDNAVLKEIGAFFQESPTAHGEESYKVLQKRLIDKGLIDSSLAHTE